MTLNDRVAIPEDVVFQKVGEETVLLNLEGGVYYGLDPVGSRFWELLIEQGSLRAVFERMVEEYDATAQTLERDLLRLAETLAAKGLIKTMDP